MRVISGKYAGRRIETLKGRKIRPTTGKVREAIFNILAHGKLFSADTSVIDNAVVLDLFCGSGSLGIEALSRGAKSAIFIDIEPSHLDIVRKNVNHIGAHADSDFIRCDSSNPPTPKVACDLVFIDPPYDSALAPKTLKNLVTTGWLKEHAVVVLELPKKTSFTLAPGFTELYNRTYGITRVLIMEWSKA